MAQNPNLFNLDPLAFKLSQQGSVFKRLKEVGPERVDLTRASQTGTADTVLAQIRANKAREQQGFEAASRYASLNEQKQAMEDRSGTSAVMNLVPYLNWIPRVYKTSQFMQKSKSDIIKNTESDPNMQFVAKTAMGVDKFLGQWSGDIIDAVGGLFGGGSHQPREVVEAGRHKIGSQIAQDYFSKIKEWNPEGDYKDLSEFFFKLGEQKATGTGKNRDGEYTYDTNEYELLKGKYAGSNIPLKDYGVYIDPYVKRLYAEENLQKQKSANEEAFNKIMEQRAQRENQISDASTLMPSSLDVQANTGLYSDNLSNLVAAKKGI